MDESLSLEPNAFEVVLLKMGKITESLDKIDSSKMDLQELYTIFNSVNNIPIIHLTLECDSFLIRQRLNDNNNSFETESDLTYPPLEFCTKYSRANIPYHPMFYSSITVQEDVPYARMVVLMETSEFFKDVTTCGIERSTISKWNVIKSLNLLAMPFNDNYQRSNDFIDNIKSLWKQSLFFRKNKLAEDSLELIEYMSKEISKQCNDSDSYFKIANFVYYLLYINKSTLNFDGIVYPSVPSAGEGVNVVLKPDVADNKLQFESAAICHVAKREKKSFEMIYSYARNKDNNGHLIYVNHTPSPLELDKYNKLAIGLNFMN